MSATSTEWLVRGAYGLTGLVHLLPLAGVLGRSALERAYGVELGPGPDLVILMQHRALLFGLLALACFVAIPVPAWRVPAGVAALASMLGFVLLAGLHAHNAAIARVVWVDVAGAVALGVGLLAHARAGTSP